MPILGGCAAIGLLIASVMASSIPSQLERAVAVYREDGYTGFYSRLIGHVGLPNVHWEETVPESVGLKSEVLESLRGSLAAQGTVSLIVARDDRIAIEWYAEGNGPNQTYLLAAAAKGVTGCPILLAALTDKKIGLDERVAKYVPGWQQDPWKSEITIRQLASHSSGLDDVNFNKVQSGWKDVYRRNPSQRFRLALNRAPILFEPGTQHAYSGVGYYVLAYVLGTVLKDSADHPDLKSFLRDRINKPLGIPSNAWGLSYGESYQIDGMTLYAIGSGAIYTARAVARIGELFVRNGEWNGRQLIDSEWVSRALSYANSPPNPAVGAPEPQAGLGWYVNSNGFFPSLPEDAAFSVGEGYNILLVVPSQRLVAVLIDGSLGEPGDDFWQTIEQQFFKPLMASIVPGS